MSVRFECCRPAASARYWIITVLGACSRNQQQHVASATAGFLGSGPPDMHLARASLYLWIACRDLLCQAACPIRVLQCPCHVILSAGPGDQGGWGKGHFNLQLKQHFLTFIPLWVGCCALLGMHNLQLNMPASRGKAQQPCHRS